MKLTDFELHPATLALLCACPALSVAAPDSTSAYVTDPQHSYVEDRTSEGVNQVNMIMCFIGAMKADEMVNKGNYVALVDDSKCDSSGRSDAGNSGSNSANTGASEYVTATLSSARASNTDPMIVKTWVDESDEGIEKTIYVHTSASEAPSSTNPYGNFSLHFCGKPVVGGTGQCMFNGYIDANASGLGYYETGGQGPFSRVIAMRLTSSGAQAGSGRLSMNETGPMGSQATDFLFAYNQNYFRRSNGTDDLCFSRDASDADTGFSVWRYGLYNETDGTRINRNSGFPIEYTSDGTTHHGFMGYWGLWLPDSVLSTASSGDTIQKVDYSGGNALKANYTLVKAGGKLTKYTKGTKTLAALDKIRFTIWASAPTGPAGLTGYSQGKNYEMYWDNTAGQFIVTGEQVCGNNGCTMTTINPAVTTANAYWQANYQFGVNGWSQALGGEVFIDTKSADFGVNSALVNVIYRLQSLVYPSDYAAIGDLHCVNDCPTTTSIAAYVANPQTPGATPFGTTAGRFNGVLEADLLTYTLNSTSANVENGGSAVIVTSTLEGPYQWGVRTGKLFPVSQKASVVNTPGDDKYYPWKVDGLDVYYVWETGPKPWNQFSAVKDGSGVFVQFDPPLSVTYNVPAGAAYGKYAGTSIVLQYNGYGDLWGIPGECVDHTTNLPVDCNTSNARYVPEFVIPYSQTDGKVSNNSTNYLAKWLEREIRFAKKDLSVCTGAGLNLPAQGSVTLPDQTGLKDPSNSASDVFIGSKPTVTDAPRVVHGEVKY